MRWTKMLIPTVKEVPADAEIISHRLMIRAAIMRKLASGTYSYLPLGFRTLQKVMAIVRSEMNAAGSQEILLPSVQPIELWQQTGRDADYGETMCKFKDRHGRINVLAPTAEEVVTHLAAGEINSYKQLPLNIYQISFKFRDEFRPRFGVLRSREFIMKDAYSFHGSAGCLEKTYKQMYQAYSRIFQRCGLPYIIVEAESGEMGGSGSHQFTIPCENGEDVIVHTEDGSYAANLERASVDPTAKQPQNDDTPAVEDVHTPGVGSIEAVCQFLKTKPQQMIKTLIYTACGKTVVAIIRGDHELNDEKLTQTLGGTAAELADEATINKVSGSAVGFAGPIGIAERADIMLIDHSVAAMSFGIAGANKTDYHTKNVVPDRDFPLEAKNVRVCDIRNATEGDTYDGKKLLFKRGIEVGQVFKLGTKYSAKLNAKFLDEQGAESPCIMGCYGIGINRIVASAIETGSDENGIIWPIGIAPFEVLITSVNQDDQQVSDAAEKIYEQLTDRGVEVLFDDRQIRGGVKFKDADLIGIPIRLTVGKRGLADGKVEIKLRRSDTAELVALTDASERIVQLKQKLYDELKVCSK